MNQDTKHLFQLNVGDVFTLDGELSPKTKIKIQADLTSGVTYIVTKRLTSNFTKSATPATFAHDVTNIYVDVAPFNPNDDHGLRIPASAVRNAYFTSDYGGFTPVPVRLMGRRTIQIEYVVLGSKK